MKCDFFAKLVLVKGRLLKVDECTTNKLRSEYAYIMMNIDILEEINLVE